MHRKNIDWGRSAFELRTISKTIIILCCLQYLNENKIYALVDYFYLKMFKLTRSFRIKPFTYKLKVENKSARKSLWLLLLLSTKLLCWRWFIFFVLPAVLTRNDIAWWIYKCFIWYLNNKNSDTAINCNQFCFDRRFK